MRWDRGLNLLTMCFCDLVLIRGSCFVSRMFLVVRESWSSLFERSRMSLVLCKGWGSLMVGNSWISLMFVEDWSSLMFGGSCCSLKENLGRSWSSSVKRERLNRELLGKSWNSSTVRVGRTSWISLVKRRCRLGKKGRVV